MVVEPAGWFGLLLCWSLSCVAPGGVVPLAIAPVLVVDEPLLFIAAEESAGAEPGALLEELAEGGVGALCASVLLLEEDGDGLLIEVVVGGSVLSALWQALNATAANTGARRAAYFMMCPFSEGRKFMFRASG